MAECEEGFQLNYDIEIDFGSLAMVELVEPPSAQPAQPARPGFALSGSIIGYRSELARPAAAATDIAPLFNTVIIQF